MARRDSFQSLLPWLAALVLVTGIHVTVLQNWIRRDTLPPAWDQAVHTRVALEYRDRWRAEPDLVELLKPAYFNYPPLYHLTLTPFLDRVADLSDVGALVNSFYLALLIFSVFFIAQPLLGSVRGFSAAVLVSCYPIIIVMARETMIDLALTAWVAFSVLCLVRSENFSRRGWSVAFGIATALAMLTKWSSPIYVCGPAVWALIVGFKERQWKNILLSTLAGLVVLAPWYLLNLIPMLGRVTKNVGMPVASGRFTSGLAYVFWYPIALISQLNLPFLLLLVPGLVAGVRRRELRPYLLWLAVPMALFTLIVNRNERYSMPILPAAAILSVAWLPSGKKWPAFAVTGLAAVFFFAFSALQRPLEWRRGQLTIGLVSSLPPKAQDWRHDEIIERVRSLKGSADFSRVITVSNAPFFHSTSMNVSLRQAGVTDFSFVGPSKRRWMDFAEFIVVKTGDLGPDFTIGTVGECAAFLQESPEWFARAYREVGRWDLPDKSEAVLYHWDPQPVQFSGVDALSFELEEMELPKIKLRNVKVRALAESQSASRLGRLKEITLQSDLVSYQGIEMRGVRFRLVKPVINLQRPMVGGELPQIVSLEAIEPSLSVSSSTLLAYAARKAKWLKDPRIVFDGPRIRISGSAGVPVQIWVRAEVRDGALRPSLERLAIAGIPLPRLPFMAVVNKPFPLVPNREMPFRASVARIEGKDGYLTVESQ